MTTNKKILLLCQGNRQTSCPLVGFPLTKKIMKISTSLDINKEVEPDIVEDFTKPTKIKKNTYDIITGVCCVYWLIIEDDGKIVNQFFKNTIKILKKGGHLFINDLPLYGCVMFCKLLLNNKFYTNTNTNTNTNNKNNWFNKKLPDPINKVELLSKSVLLKILNSYKNKNEEYIWKYKNRIFYLFILYIDHIYPELKLIIKKNDIKNVLVNLADEYMDNLLKTNLLSVYNIKKTTYQYNTYMFSFIFEKI